MPWSFHPASLPEASPGGGWVARRLTRSRDFALLSRADRDAHHGYLGPYLAPAPPPAPLQGPYVLQNSLGGTDAPPLCLSASVGKPPALAKCSALNASSSAMWYKGTDGPGNSAVLQTLAGDCLKIHEVPTQDCGSWATVYLGSCRGELDNNNSFTLDSNTGTIPSNRCAGRCVAWAPGSGGGGHIHLGKGCDAGAGSSTGGWVLSAPSA